MSLAIHPRQSKIRRRRPNRENLEAIERYGNIEVVGTIPWLDTVDRKMLLRVFRKYFGQNFLLG